ncbi:MAG: hypothetical protein ACPLPR_05605 [Bacillota bacterium]
MVCSVAAGEGNASTPCRVKAVPVSEWEIKSQSKLPDPPGDGFGQKGGKVNPVRDPGVTFMKFDGPAAKGFQLLNGCGVNAIAVQNDKFLLGLNCLAENFVWAENATEDTLALVVYIKRNSS